MESAALGEEDKSKIVVVGDGVDAVKLTSLLRKKLTKRSKVLACLLPKSSAHVELISVGAAGAVEKKQEDETKNVVWSYGYSMPQYVIYGDYF